MQRTTHCPLDCPDACSLRVEVDGQRVTAVDGSSRNPITADFICAKVRRIPELLYGDDRLRYPALRSGSKGSGEFRRVSWDEALDVVAKGLQAARDEHGGESIVPLSYGGSNGLLTQDTTDARLFRRLGASRLARTVCAVPTTEAALGLYGKIPGVAFQDYVQSKLIVVWGCNPAATGIHLLPFIRAAQRGGARLVVVDPRRNRLAAQSDLHLAVRPGTDLVVALAILDWLFSHGRADLDFLARRATGTEELRRRAGGWPVERAAEVAGIEAGVIEQLATWYADDEPAVIRCGWGMERNRNGCSAVAAVLSLPAVAGKFGVRGGGYTLSNSGAFAFDPSAAAAEPETTTRTVNMNRLARTLEEASDPPVKVLFSYNCNPVATLPDQQRLTRALLREDLFTVVFEQVMTDSARFADVLLPATTFLEHAEIQAAYGAMVVQGAGAVVSAEGEARPNYEVFAELCERVGVAKAGDPTGADEIGRAIVGDVLAERLRRDGLAEAEGGMSPVQFVDIFPRTADGMIHLVPPRLDAEAPLGLYGYQPDPGGDDYPLALVSPATSQTVSSTFGQLRRRQVAVQVHPEDAAARQIADGAQVRVFNQLGEVHCLARVTGRVRSGVLFLPKGLWSHNTLNGRTANALVPDSLTDIGGGACFNDARVQIAPLV